MRTCESIREQLLMHQAGELNPEDRCRVEEHLAACQGCRDEAALLRGAIERVQALPVPEVPPGFWHAFETSVRQRIAQEPTPRLSLWARILAKAGRVPGLRPGPVLAAATMLGLILAVGLVRTVRPPPEAPPVESLVVSVDLGIGQNLEVLEQLDLLENVEVLERLDVLRSLDGVSPAEVS